MNAGDQSLLSWLQSQINSGRRSIIVPASVMKDASPDGLAEARRQAKLCGVELVVHG